MGNQVKICIEDLGPYKDLCERQLGKLRTNQIAITQFHDRSVVTHFSNLNDMIKKCEVDPVYCSQIVSNLPVPIFNLISEVTQATGPQFLSGSYIKTDLSYPSETVGAWSTPEEGLDHRSSGNYTHPPSVMDWGCGNPFPGEQEASDKFTQDCEGYRKCLGAYYYGKKFGENHPFNLVLKAYLIDHYPYRSDSFRDLLKINFAYHNKEVPQKYRLNLINLTDDSDESKVEIMGKDECEEGILYLEITKESALKYKAKSHTQLVEGTFNIDIENINLNSRRELQKFLRVKKDDILSVAGERGLCLPPKKGKTREEHRNISYERATKNVRNHYGVLAYLLENLGIGIPPVTLADFDF